MRKPTIIIAVTIFIAVGLLASFGWQGETSNLYKLPSSEELMTEPTSPVSRRHSSKKIASASPTPMCSPQPTPLSEEEQNNPFREQTSEERLDGLGGTPDWDCDGICNRQDNCIFVYNPDQKDRNGDGKGDACDPKLVDSSFTDSRCDYDGDGIPDREDNCPGACNPDQKFVDVNENGVNDLCDSVLPNYVPGQPCAKRKKVKAPKTKDSSSRKDL